MYLFTLTCPYSISSKKRSFTLWGEKKNKEFQLSLNAYIIKTTVFDIVIFTALDFLDLFSK